MGTVRDWREVEFLNKGDSVTLSSPLKGQVNTIYKNNTSGTHT